VGVRYLLTSILCISLFGCALFYTTKKPIDSIYYVTGKAPSDSLIVMLPGGGDEPADFMRNGLIKAVQDSGIRADAIAVDANLGYYFKRNLLPRLHEDVIIPAKQKGYKKIWLLGISMGGLGAMIYAKHYPDHINGLVLLAPFLGYPGVVNEIADAGGLSRWSPQEQIDKDDYQHDLWKWLKGYTRPEENHPRLVIGYGKEDKFAAGAALLAEVLPKDQVHIVQGRHDWEAWGRIFDLILQSGAISGSDR
jgi:pimeloyl-ACP methyl ester carboxylesterase